MGFPEAWRTTKGKGVVVAVLDTGADLHHPDLAGQLLVAPGADLVDPDGCEESSCVQDGPMDPHGHGTAMAGIIAARAGNGEGMAGAAPRARILPVRVRSADATVLWDAVAQGIVFATDHGADVINMSLAAAAFPYEVEGVWQDNDPFCMAAVECRQLKHIFAAIQYAWEHGAVLVAAAGNGYPVEGVAVPSCSQPAGHPRVLCVGATDFSDEHSYYSHSDPFNANLVVAPSGGDISGSVFGSEVAPCAERILATVPATLSRPCPGDLPVGYTYVSGTSSATAFTSALAALLVSEGLSNDEVMATIMATARDLGPPGRDPVFGHGQVDAAAATASVQMGADSDR
jgi:subtilisin family serine protease